jgi:hypothetical protein
VEIRVSAAADADEVASVRKGAHKVSIGKVSSIGLDRGKSRQGKRSSKQLSLGPDDPLRGQMDQGASDAEPVKAKRRARAVGELGTRVDFKAAFGPDSDLAYDITDSAVKESVIASRLSL